MTMRGELIVEGTMSAESPFKRKTKLFFKEPSLLRATWRQGLRQLDTSFLQNIPSDRVKQLPPIYLYPVGTIVLFVLVGIFVAVFVPGYNAAIRTKFLSPVGSGNSKYCDDVTISNTGTFLATKTGNWQGSPSFAYSNSTYSINLVNVQMDENEFAYSMRHAYANLEEIGNYAVTQNLGINLLYWMSWVYVGANLERFSMTGTPLVVFQKEHTVGTISNKQGDCNGTSLSSFNPSTGILQLGYDLAEYNTNPTCAGNGDLSLYGYSSIARSSMFTVDFDVRTLITAVAVNSNVTSVNKLQVVASVFYKVKGVPYFSASYVDPRYPGMDPVLCMFREGTPHCLLTVGGLYGIPVFNHIGNNLSHPAQCNCTQEIPKGVNTKYDNLCNQFNFLTGVLVWPHSPIPELPDAALELMLNYTASEISSLAYVPMFTAGAYGMSSPERADFDAPAARAEMYDFCDSAKYGACSIITFSLYDSTLLSHVVSTNFYSIDYGACADTFSTTLESWDELIQTPFAPLTQQYQTCNNDPFTTFITQAGASAGNVTLLSPAGVLLVLGLLAVYQMCTGKRIPTTYSEGEKSAALDALAVALLLVRDKRVIASKAKADPRISTGSTNNDEHEGDDGNDAYDVHLLAELVQQLGNIAPATEKQEYIYREEGEEPVSVNWQEVAKIASPLASLRGVRGGSSVDGARESTNTAGTELTAMPAKQV